MGTAGWIGPRCELICACLKLTTRKLGVTWLNMSDCKCGPLSYRDSSFKEEAEFCVKFELYLFPSAEQSLCLVSLWNLIFLQPFAHLPVFVNVRCSLSHPPGKIRGSLTKTHRTGAEPHFWKLQREMLRLTDPLPFLCRSSASLRGERRVRLCFLSIHIFSLFHLSTLPRSLRLRLRFCGALTFAHSLHRQSFLKPTLFVIIALHVLLLPILSCACNVCVQCP